MTKKKKSTTSLSLGQARLKRLLGRGYFPGELPPPFTTVDFGAAAPALASKWDGKDIRKYWTRAERYSVPRWGPHARRVVSLVNPVNQLHIADLISSNWDAIRKRLERSNITEFHPEIVRQGPGRAVTGVDFDGVARRRAEILGAYGRLVKTDVARFYPSLYTHAIPWAIVGKSVAKAKHHDAAFKKSFPNLLDKAVGAGQEGQTIGIPIGPDTSRILSELIAVEIETLVRNEIPDLDQRAVRYVDDMLIGLRETEAPPAVLSSLSVALSEYELELNAEKTVTLGMGCPHAPEWIHYVRAFAVSTKPNSQREDLDSYFEHAMHLADANPRENVLLFASRRAASFEVDDTNRAHLVRWLLYAARRSAGCLSFVAEHLAATHSSPAMPTNEIHSYIIEQLPVKSEAGHTDEVAWLLFWAREIGLTLPAAALNRVLPLRSSVVALLTLDLVQLGRVSGPLDLSAWQSAATEEGLKSELWLVAYEATKKGWWPSTQSPDFITKHAFFADLWTAGIEFYDPKKRARKTVKPTFLKSAPGANVLAGYPD